MKKTIPLLLTLLYLSAAWGQRCLSDEILKHKIETQPEVLARRMAIEANRLSVGDIISPRNVVTVQVVVHVVYLLPIENISDAQIQSQIDVLNEDFRLQNANASIVTWPAFAEDMADMEIEFELAHTDPLGQPTNGITRTPTIISGIAMAFSGNHRKICFTELGGQDAWCPERYLNIWVGQFPPGFAGEGTYPGEVEPDQDGVFVDPYHFGRTGIALPPFNLGRTLTHEIGHYFDLSHIWGNCVTDDGFGDTPMQKNPTSGCPTGWAYTSCNSKDQYVNYMDFTDDACMAMFTLEQKQRVQATLNGPRSGLLTPGLCGTVGTLDQQYWFTGSIYPNPAKERVYLDLPEGNNSIYELEIFDVQGKRVSERIRMNSGKHELDTLALGSGVFFVKINQGENYIIKKLILLKTP